MHEPLHRRAALLMNALTAKQPSLSRRDVLRAAMALAASSLVPGALFAAGPPKPRFTAYPFSLGVASGYPRADRVTLWTRLAPQPLRADGGMQREMIHM